MSSVKRGWATWFLLIAALIFLSSVSWRVLGRAAISQAESEPPTRGETLFPSWTSVFDSPRTNQALVLVFTVDCPWCRASVPWWNELVADFQSIQPDGVAIGVSPDSAHLVKAYARERAMSYQMITDSLAQQLLQSWHVRNVPYTLVVDRSGLVRGVWRGLIDSLRYHEIVRSLRQDTGAVQ